MARLDDFVREDHPRPTRGSPIDGRTNRYPGYRLTQIVRERIEKYFR